MISFTHHYIYIYSLFVVLKWPATSRSFRKREPVQKMRYFKPKPWSRVRYNGLYAIGNLWFSQTKSCFARWNTANDCDYRRCGGTWEIILSHTVNFSKRPFHEICTRFSGTVFNVCCGFISKSRSIHIIHLPIFSGSLHWHRGQSCVLFIYLFIFIISLLRLNKNAFGTSKHGGIKR